MTLEMFMHDDVTPMTEGHIAALMQTWKKVKPSDKLYEFNRDWYTKFFQQCNDAQLSYYAGLSIPHYSNWAVDVATARGI